MSDSYFPNDITLEEVQQIQNENPKTFSQRTKNNLIIFNYKMGHILTFPNPFTTVDGKKIEKHLSRKYQIRREMRGLIFCQKTKTLICRPFHKFFNVNELDETDESMIKLKGRKYVILEKLDGGFVSGMLDRSKEEEGIVRLVSKTGYGNKNTRKAESFVKQSKIKYFDFVEKWVKNNFTPIFEFVDVGKIRVVKYQNSSLILIAIRSIKTGSYVTYKEMVDSAKEFNIPYVKSLDIKLKKENIQELVQKIKKMKDVEGFCLKMEDDGNMYKLKTDYYVDQGRGNADLAFQEHLIWKLILNAQIDDYKASCAKIMLKKRIDSFTTLMFKEINNLHDRMSKTIEEINNTKKSVSEYASVNNITGLEKTLLFKLKEIPQEDFFDEIKDFLKRNTKNVNKMRSLLNNIRFY